MIGDFVGKKTCGASEGNKKLLLHLKILVGS